MRVHREKQGTAPVKRDGPRAPAPLRRRRSVGGPRRPFPGPRARDVRGTRAPGASRPRVAQATAAPWSPTGSAGRNTRALSHASSPSCGRPRTRKLMPEVGPAVHVPRVEPDVLPEGGGRLRGALERLKREPLVVLRLLVVRLQARGLPERGKGALRLAAGEPDVAEVVRREPVVPRDPERPAVEGSRRRATSGPAGAPPTPSAATARAPAAAAARAATPRPRTRAESSQTTATRIPIIGT